MPCKKGRNGQTNPGSKTVSGYRGTNRHQSLIARGADRVGGLKLGDIKNPLHGRLQGANGQAPADALKLPAQQEKLPESGTADVLQAGKIKDHPLGPTRFDLPGDGVLDHVLFGCIKSSLEGDDKNGAGFFELDFHDL